MNKIKGRYIDYISTNLHYMAITLSFITLSVIITSCSGYKVNDVRDKTMTTTTQEKDNDRESMVTPKSRINGNKYIRYINGQPFELQLTGKFYQTFKSKGQEYPLEVKEIYPEIVCYDKYDTLMVYDDRQQDSMMMTTKVVDKIEFFDREVSVKALILDDINPYLTADDEIEIMKHFSDAENTEMLLGKDGDKEYIIDTYHVNHHVQSHGSYTTINFWNHEISEGWIVNTPTTVMILDSLGNVIFNHEFDRSMGIPTIDPNSEFMMLSFSGVETVNTSIMHQPDGFEIWQVSPKALIHRKINNDQAFYVNPAKYSAEDHQLTATFSNVNSNSDSFRANVENISSQTYLFDVRDRKLKYYEVPISSVIQYENDLKEGNTPKNWNDVKASLKYTDIDLNYGEN